MHFLWNCLYLKKNWCTGELPSHQCSGEMISPVFHRCTSVKYRTLTMNRETARQKYPITPWWNPRRLTTTRPIRDVSKPSTVDGARKDMLQRQISPSSRSWQLTNWELLFCSEVKRCMHICTSFEPCLTDAGTEIYFIMQSRFGEVCSWCS